MTQQRVSPISVTSTLPAVPVLSLQAALGQTADLQQWQNSAGTKQGWIDSSGFNIYMYTYRSQANPTTGSYIVMDSNQTRVTQQTAGAVAFIVRGAASQTANLQEWQDSAGAVLTRVNATGNIVTTGSSFHGTSSQFDSTLNVSPLVTNWKGIVVRGLASQTANLQEWQNSGGTVIAKVDSTGYFGTGGVFGLNNRWSFEEAFGGAFAMIQRSTSTVTNPGSDKARIYIVTGTNAGTLKLVVKAGSAGAETTILDNIPQT